MQKLRFSRYFKVIFMLIDIIVITAVFVFFFLRNYSLKYDEGFIEQNLLSIVLLSFYWILLSGSSKLYSIPRNLTYPIYLERLLTHIFIFIFGVILLAKASNNDFLKQDRFLIASALFILLSVIKSFIFYVLKYLRTRGFNHRNIMFLSENSSTQLLKNILEKRKDFGFKLFDYHKNSPLVLEELVKFWKENGIHTLYLPSEDSELPKDLETEIFHLAEMHKVRISLIPNIIQNNFFQYDLDYIETQPVLSQSKFPLDYLTNYILKRIFDLVFSVCVLLLLCTWIFPIIALLIVLDSKGPVFFVQKRYGYRDEVFKCIKFRTMYINGRSDHQTTLDGDERVTKIGKFLRRSSLDEMPQFINVLKGEMSVVGPRPHMLLVDNFYKPKIGRYTVRSLVKPGVTGLAQVNGLRGDSGDMNIEMQKRVLADSFYIKNWSIVLDMVIILKTAFLVFKGDKNAR